MMIKNVLMTLMLQWFPCNTDGNVQCSVVKGSSGQLEGLVQMVKRPNTIGHEAIMFAPVGDHGYIIRMRVGDKIKNKETIM